MGNYALMESPADRVSHIDAFQNAMRVVLDSYVNGAYLSRRSRYLHPLSWRLSPWSVTQAMRELARAALPLRQDSNVARFLEHVDRWMRELSAPPESALAETLADGYRCLDGLLLDRGDTADALLPEARSFHPETYLEPDRAYFRPVVALERYTARALSPYLSDAWIHGSVADMRLARGYSDLDVLYVLARETATDAAKLRSFARKCYRAQIYLYAFDPLQHHGFQVMTAVDWLAYPQTWLPLDALRAGVLLVQTTQHTAVRDARPEAEATFEKTVAHFVRIAQNGWRPTNVYDFKYFLSVLMLLPARFLQASGEFAAKSESFARLNGLDARLDTSALRTASEIRASWPNAQAPYFLAFLHPRVLKAVGAWRSQPMLSRFSGSIVNNAASLAVGMHAFIRGQQGRPIVTARCAPVVVNEPVLYSFADYDSARRSYVAQAAEERGVDAILEFGTVSVPGISDLDFVILLDDTAAVNPSALSIRRLSLAHADLIMHEPVILPSSLAPHLNEWLIFGEPTLLYRRSTLYPIPTGFGGEDVFPRIARLLEKLYRFRLWFTSVRRLNELDARWSMATLKSLQYSISIVESLTRTSFAMSGSFSTDLKELREGWFISDTESIRREQLRCVHFLGEELYQQALPAVEAWLASEGWLDLEPSKDIGPLERMCGLYAREAPLAAALRAAPGPGARTTFERYLVRRAEVLAAQQTYLTAKRLPFGHMY